MEVAAVWAAIEQVAPRDRIAAAVAVVDGLVPDDDVSIDAAVRILIADRYRVVRPFLIGLCELRMPLRKLAPTDK